MATKQSDNSVKLTASLTRNYGAVSASFGAEIIIDGGSPETTNSGYALLLDIIGAQFDHFESAVLHKTIPDPAIFDAKGAGAKPEIIECETMVVETYQGKTVYKVRGGRFTKFGVPIYPEVLSQYRDLDKLAVGSQYNMKGWKMAVDVSGKPKVLQLVAPA